MSTRVRRILHDQAEDAARRTAERRAAAQVREAALLRRLEEVQIRHGRLWDIHPAAWPWVDGAPLWWVAIRRPWAERPRTHRDQDRTHTCPDLDGMAAWLEHQAVLDADATL